MSMSALLRGVEKRLRSAAVFDDDPGEAVGKFVGVHPDGNPPNNFGQFYCAVFPMGATNLDRNAQSSDWAYSVGVTVTGRLNYAPKDRRGARMTTTGDLLDRAVAVADALHQDDLHRLAANELIPGTEEFVALQGSGTATVNGFLEPLRLAGIDPVRPAPPTWGGLTDTANVFTVALRFVDAIRTQKLGS